MGKRLSIAEALDRKKPHAKVYCLCLDPDLGAEYMKAAAKLAEAQKSLTMRPTDPALLEGVAVAETDVEDAREAMDAEVMEIPVHALGGDEYDDLIAAHPATPEQRKDFRKKNPTSLQGPRWNEDSFPVALVAACTGYDEAEIKALKNHPNVNASEWDGLFGLAWQVNETRDVVDVGKGSRTTPSSESSSDTASTT